VLFVLAIAGSAHGQQVLDGVSFSVELLNLATAGADIDQVQIFSMRQTIEQGGTFTQRSMRVDYGTDFRRIDMRPDADRALLWSAGYRRGAWGVSVRRWNTDGDATFEEQVASSPVRATAGVGVLSESQTIQGCRMWDNTQPPVVNVGDPSGFSPLNCYARNSLEASKIDVLMERAWIDTARFQTDVRLGVTMGRIEHRRAEGQEQNALLGPQGAPSPLGTVDRFTNRITLDSTGEASGQLWGPAVELAGSIGFGRLQADWRLNQSVLIGDVDLSSEWIDIDDIRVTGRIGTIPVSEADRLEGHYPFSSRKRVALPVLDSEVKVGVRIVEMLTAGVGVFVSSWQSVPLASSWSVPGDWTDAAGTHWKPNEPDLLFHGMSFFARVVF
jgi:hypothetical protein